MRARLFKFLAKMVITHPRTIVAAAVIIAIACGIYASIGIKLNANLDELVSEKLDYHRRYLDFLKEFGDEEYLYVVVDASSDLMNAKQFMARLATRLEGRTGLKQLIWKIDNPVLEKNFLLYMTDDQLKSLSAMTGAGPFSVKNIASWNSFTPMFGAMANRLATPVSAQDEAELSTGFKFIDGLLDDISGSLAGNRPYKSRLQELFFGGDESFDPDGYLKNGSLLFMMIMPEKDFTSAKVIERPLIEVRAAIDEIKKEFPGIEAGLTGRPVLNADEMETSNKDMTLATILALALVAIVFIIFFRGIARPLCAVASLIIGIAWTFGFLALIFGTLNILSSVFALLLIGASIEYSIYIVARYEEELSKSGDVALAITTTLHTTGMANITSALTTAAAFLTLLWTDFTAIAELGAISAMGIILCLTAMLVVLPAMLMLRDRNRSIEKLREINAFALPMITKIYWKPTIVFIVAMIAIIFAAPFIKRIGFDNNLLNLQAEGLDSVKYEHLIIEKSSETTWFARAVANTPEESHAKANALRKLDSVRRVDDVERIVPEGQDAKIGIIKEMAKQFTDLKFEQPTDSIDVKKLQMELERIKNSLSRLQEEAFKSNRIDAVDGLEIFQSKISRTIDLLSQADEGSLIALGLLQNNFFADLKKSLTILSSGMNPTNIALSDLPRDVASRFTSPSGRYSLYIYPKEDIWNPITLEKFISDIRSVDNTVIGTPIEVYESGRLMRSTFMRSAILSFIVICILIWLDFKNIRSSIIAITTLVAGLIMLFSAMGIFGIQFNMANFFAIPILIGTGIDFGVQVTHRLRQERSFDALGTSTGKGLIMTALANGIGFGTMMIAHHRGVASLGQILVLGCVFCLIAALAITPPIAKWLGWGFAKK